MSNLLRVEYILVAEFDINEGSTLKHQYPKPTGEDESYLAELMLPDGSHSRGTDWSMFLLNSQYTYQPSVNSTEKHMLYAINLVRTKRDSEAKRGAMVKAMAFCSRSNYIHIYRPLILLALEQYYRSPEIETLSNIYNSLNSQDTSFIPRLSTYEQRILRFSMDVPVYQELLDQADLKSVAISSIVNNGALSDNTIACASYKSTDSNLVPVNDKALPYHANKDRKMFQINFTYLDVKLPIKIPLTYFSEEIGNPSVIKLVLKFGGSPSSTIRVSHQHLDVGNGFIHPVLLLVNAILTGKRVIFLGHNLPADEVANYVLAATVAGSGGGSVLKGLKNKIFPYTNLFSLDRLLATPGFIAGVTNPAFEDKTDWWDVLFNINTGKISISPSISKRTNSNKKYRNEDFFSHNNDMQGRLNSKSNRKDVKADKSSPHNQVFINELFYAIDNHYDEIYIRAKFESYVKHFLFLAAVYEQINYGKVDLFSIPRTPELDRKNSEIIKSRFISNDLEYGYSNKTVDKFLRLVASKSSSRQNSYSPKINIEMSSMQGAIDGFIGTDLYYNYIEQVKYSRNHDPVRTIDLYAMINRLREGINLKDEEVRAIFTLMFYCVESKEQICMLLSMLPQINHGLEPLICGMYHTNDNVKYHATMLLRRIETDVAGKLLIESMNVFHQITFADLCSQFMI